MLDLMASNLKIKIAGPKVTIKKYEKTTQFAYAVKHSGGGSKGESDHSREHFYKSVARARNKIFDIVACNVNSIADYHGDIQKPKFLTLTFAENVTDVDIANPEFTLFNKRLSYHLYGEQKNVLKYVCIPEFQKRGAVHYHVLYFNLPYVNFKKLTQIWGNGNIWIEGIKETENIEDFAKYVCKYMNKQNSKGECNYEIYKEKEMLNRKRYFSSRGLNRPEEYKLEIDKELYYSLLAHLEENHVENHEITNEFVGTIEINTYQADETVLQNVRNIAKTLFCIMKDTYEKTTRKLTMKSVSDYLNYIYFQHSEEYRCEWLYTIAKIKEYAHDHLGKGFRNVPNGSTA